MTGWLEAGDSFASVPNVTGWPEAGDSFASVPNMTGEDGHSMNHRSNQTRWMMRSLHVMRPCRSSSIPKGSTKLSLNVPIESTRINNPVGDQNSNRREDEETF